MKVGYVVSKYPAISHTFIQREVLALRERGVEVETFSIRRTPTQELLSDTDHDEASRTWSVLPVSLKRVVATHAAEFIASPLLYLKTLRFAVAHRPAGFKNFKKSVCYFAEAVLLAVQCRHQQIERLHAHFVNSGGEVALIASRHLNIPWSCTLHGLSDYGNPAANQLSKKIAAAEAVVCVSDYGRSQAMLSSSPDQWNKLHVVRCGLSNDSFVATNTSTQDSGSATLRLLTVGRLAPEKAHAGLLQAIATATNAGAKVHLSIIGDGPLRTDLERQTKELGLSECITFLGAQPPSVVRKHIGQSDVNVMSSLMEGLPVALMESQAQCRPVIAPSVAGIPELVRHNENGWLFTASRWDELAQCIIEAASMERPQLQNLGAAGRDRVAQLHSIDASAKTLALLFSRDRNSSQTELRGSERSEASLKIDSSPQPPCHQAIYSLPVAAE